MRLRTRIPARVDSPERLQRVSTVSSTSPCGVFSHTAPRSRSSDLPVVTVSSTRRNRSIGQKSDRRIAKSSSILSAYAERHFAASARREQRLIPPMAAPTMRRFEPEMPVSEAARHSDSHALPKSRPSSTMRPALKYPSEIMPDDSRANGRRGFPSWRQ